MLLLTAFVAVACGEAPSPGRQGHARDASPPFVESAGQLAWEGILACADCDGIETRLVLDREGIDRASAQPRYQLLETFLANDGGERYREQGQWRREGRLLHLQPDDGGERVFAIEPDGMLSLRDAGGAEPRGDARLLAPVIVPGP